jgi:hypothetical protein
VKDFDRLVAIFTDYARDLEIAHTGSRWAV